MSDTVTWDLVEKEYIPRHPTGVATLRLRRATDRTAKAILPDIEHLSSNTALAALLEFINLLGEVREAGDVEPSAWREARDTLLLLLAPTEPGILDVLWRHLVKPYSIHAQPFPVFNEELAQ